MILRKTKNMAGFGSHIVIIQLNTFQNLGLRKYNLWHTLRNKYFILDYLKI
jgi:predicted glycosyltransferase involved in capsule biosynthesis